MFSYVVGRTNTSRSSAARGEEAGGRGLGRDVQGLRWTVFRGGTAVNCSRTVTAGAVAAGVLSNGVKKEDVSTGVLTVAPIYEGDRKKRARSYYVQGEMVLRVRDFSHIGPILDGTVEDGIADFRSLTYSLSDEEAAKKEAVAEAMRRAIGRASIALEQKGQKLGGLRYMSLDVQHLSGVAELQNYGTTAEIVEVQSGAVGGGLFSKKSLAPPPPPPPAQPLKITVRASVQCAFQIQ